MQRGLKELPQASHFTFLPEPSFHMTQFCGVSGSPLGSDGWPKEFERGTGLREITECYLRRFKMLQLPQRVSVKPVGPDSPNRIRMEPASEKDARALQQIRDSLQDLTGIYRADISSYRFHVTLSYQTKWLETAAAEAYWDAATDLYDTYLDSVRQVDFGPLEFCEFDTMHHFPALALIDDS
ncbi:hypothetical protein GCM10007094_36410 [Pseudovibrio japonicus]|uniref:DUF1868 domain-containing protein n=2 Tax=Pseudovibrio japonicus TaxID=366534 RepID=A0ABQ3EP81_9HYPH|nr:hypothetical protein GCM10007094_36410 [Pseudovibrio japonicus]